MDRCPRGFALRRSIICSITIGPIQDSTSFYPYLIGCVAQFVRKHSQIPAVPLIRRGSDKSRWFGEVLKGVALQELHRDEGMALTLVNVVNRADVRMLERRGSTGFTLEAFESLMIFGEPFGQELERHKTMQFDVL